MGNFSYKKIKPSLKLDQVELNQLKSWLEKLTVHVTNDHTMHTEINMLQNW